MSTVQPPPPPSTNAATTAAQALATAVKAPPAVSQLTPGQSLQALITALPHTQLVQVQTSLGPISLQTPLAVPPNAVLSLVVSKQGPKPTFIIAEINGMPVPAAQGILKAVTGAVQTVNTTPAAPLAQGTQLGASLLRAAPSLAPSGPPMGGATPAQSATPTTQTPTAAAQPQATPRAGGNASSPTPVVSSTVPGTTHKIVGQSPQSPQHTPQTPSSPPSPHSTQATPGVASPQMATLVRNSQGLTGQPISQTSALQSTLPSGTRFTVSIMQIGNASTVSATPSSPGLAQGAVLSGTVRGVTPQGQPIVQAPNATLALDTRAQVSDGTRVVLKVETVPTLPSPTKAAALAPAQTLVQAKTWSDLDEALKVLSTIDPARFQHVAQTSLPQPGVKLTAQMLFFLSALKGGDFKAWLGDSASRVIDRERPGLLTRLSGDFQIMAKMADEPQQNDWRLALIPFLNGNSIEQVRFYHRGRNGGENDDDGDEGTRFVLDLDLSNIGHVQIDGLVKSEQKRMDLIVRTETPLNEDWRADIAEIFVNAQDLIGLDGGVAFQAAPGNFIEFPPITSPEPHPGLFA